MYSEIPLYTKAKDPNTPCSLKGHMIVTSATPLSLNINVQIKKLKIFYSIMFSPAQSLHTSVWIDEWHKAMTDETCNVLPAVKARLIDPIKV
jgi:hypothetical protein